MSVRALVLGLFLFAAAGSPAAAQSIFNSAGLGLPSGTTDGRHRALGNVGLGLPGGALIPGDPAAAARLSLPTGVLVTQPSWSEASKGAESNNSSGMRFPLMAAAFPAFGGVLSAQAASLTDQTFQGVRDTDLTLGGQPVVARDSFEQDGGVSMLSLGFARRVAGETAIGISLGRYAGKLDRVLVRSTIADQGPVVQPYVSDGSWSYRGYFVTAGVATRFAELVNVSASATWSGDLEAEASETTVSGSGSYDVPLQLRVGASASLAPGLLLSAAATRSNWSSVEDQLNGGIATQAGLAYGFGLELGRFRLIGRQAPLRLGWRHADLPFSPEAEEGSEQAFVGGLGLTLNQTGEFVLATVDVGVERGSRSAGSLTEDFWRATLSVQLSGL